MKRRVTFVSEIPSWREIKLAWGLHRAGWSITLLHKAKPPALEYNVFHDVIQSDTPWENAHTIGGIFHNFSWCGDETSVRLVQTKPGTVIFDSYDNVFSMFDTMQPDPLRQNQISVQTLCLREADAIVCRDLQMAYRRKETLLGRGKPLLLFPEYCWNHTPIPERRTDGEVHIVQIGYMGLEPCGEVDEGAFMIYEKLVMAGCHLHIYLHPSYPHPDNPEFHRIFCDYLALHMRTGRVLFHKTVSPQEVVPEISRFDFGGNANNGMTFNVPREHNPARYPYCGSARMFDYLDAGLGQIFHRQLTFMWRTFRKYGIGIDVSDILAATPNIRAMLDKRPDRSIFQKARAALSIERNIHRLIGFYESLV